MLTAVGERAPRDGGGRLGVNEFLLKPVSTKALHGQLLTKPCRMAKKGQCYIPEPRKMSSYLPDIELEMNELVLVN